LIHRAIEKKRKAARIDLSAGDALTAVKSVRVVDIDLGDGTAKRSVTTAPFVPLWCCTPSALRKSIRQPRDDRAKP
jgi:hypothetical protein